MSNQAADIVSNILEECISVHKERDAQYGDSYNNFTDIAQIATKLSNKQFTATDIAVCMIATKEARYKYALSHPNMKNQEKVIHDSIVDWINYIAIMENIRIITQQKTTDKDAQNGIENS